MISTNEISKEIVKDTCNKKVGFEQEQLVSYKPSWKPLNTLPITGRVLAKSVEDQPPRESCNIIDGFVETFREFGRRSHDRKLRH